MIGPKLCCAGRVYRGTFSVHMSEPSLCACVCVSACTPECVYLYVFVCAFVRVHTSVSACMCAFLYRHSFCVYV